MPDANQSGGMADQKPVARLTNSSDETELARLLSGDQVFNIPYFQRAYKWKTDKLHQLENDLLNAIDKDDNHFLGAIILHGRVSAPADPTVYEVIDGQQRITTVFLYICAIVKSLCKQDLYDDASALLLKYLLIGRDTKLVSNSKLHSCKQDRPELNKVLQDVLADKTLASRLLPVKYKPLPSVAAHRGRIWKNYLAAQRFLDDQIRLEGLQRLEAIIGTLLNSISLVQILVKNPTDGPKIFDSLNSRQEPMTTGDLVRNEIFSRVAEKHPEAIEAIDQNSWQPFYGRFAQDHKNLFDAYFFPYGLIKDPNVKKSDVYEMLRKSWRTLTDPEVIIEQLKEYQGAFLDCSCGTNLQDHAALVAAGFARLHQANAPSSTYPFLMQLSNAVQASRIQDAVALDVLVVLESFLVRRAVCGHEPTGLHAVFKRLWQDCEGAPDRERVIAAIRKHKTVVWPGTDDFREAVKLRPLYKTSIVRHLLIEWNKSLGGDQPQGESWVEHVLPEKPVREWFDSGFTEDQHKEMKDRLANLLLLSKEMNQDLGNALYSVKRPIYRKDSGFKAAREFADHYGEWTVGNLEARAHLLGNWAIERWKY